MENITSKGNEEEKEEEVSKKWLQRKTKCGRLVGGERRGKDDREKCEGGGESYVRSWKRKADGWVGSEGEIACTPLASGW